MKKISHVLALILLSSSLQSFEDLYLKCGKEEGYFNIVFGITQSWNDYLSSIGRTDEEELLTFQIATNKFNNFITGDYFAGKTDGDSLKVIDDPAYWIDRTTGKAYITSNQLYSQLNPVEEKKKREQCKKNLEPSSYDWGFCDLPVYVENKFIGNCSKISYSDAKRYAGKLFTPAKKAERKF